MLPAINQISVVLLFSDVPDADTVNGRSLVQAGTVDFYRLVNDDEQVELEPFLTLFGDRDLSRFGSSVIVRRVVTYLFFINYHNIDTCNNFTKFRPIEILCFQILTFRARIF